MFGFPERLEWAGERRPPIDLDNSLGLANGRCALVVLIERLKPKRVWLPAYLCPSIIAAVKYSGAPLHYFATDYNLQVAPHALDDAGPGDLVDLIDYFGFPADRALMAELRDRGAWVLEDACQAMLTRDVGRTADFVLFTPRKFVGIPDAGILVSRRPEIDLRGLPLEPPPAHWWMLTFSAALLRRDFDLYGGDRLWFKQYRELEEDMPLGRYAMSDMSRMLLTSAFDYEDNARRRIASYHALNGALSDLALYPALPDGVVPLGYPIRLANRDEVLKILYAHDIYPPVHWPFPGILPAAFTESYRLQRNIMMLPCDQRCGPDDMQRIVDLVRPAAVAAPV
jgi:hypothetical protein